MLSKIKPSKRIINSIITKRKKITLQKQQKRNFSSVPDIPLPDSNKLFEFTAETIGRLPFFLEFLEPYLEKSSNLLLNFIEYSHLPLPIILFLISFCVRSTFLPMIILQTKKISKFTDKIFFLKEITKVYNLSKLPKITKINQIFKITRKASKKFKLQPLKIFCMNILHLPFLIFVIFTLRKTIVSDNIKNLSFLWVDNLLQMDPYYILPFLTCALFYYNFGKGVTPLSKNTFFGRFRYILQICMILWFPLLSHWPSAIVFYIMCNAIFSTLQMKLTSSQFFMNKVNPNFYLSMHILNQVRNSEKSFFKKLNRFLPYRIKDVVEEEEIVYRAEQELKMLKKNRGKGNYK